MVMEYKYNPEKREKLGPGFLANNWVIWNFNFGMGKYRFDAIKFRINGKEYTEWSDEFFNEYSKLQLWHDLSEKSA